MTEMRSDFPDIANLHADEYQEQQRSWKTYEFHKEKEESRQQKKQRTNKLKVEGNEPGMRAIQDSKITRLSPSRGTPSNSQDLATKPEEKEEEKKRKY